MAKYDIETLCSDIQTNLIPYLNNKISAINSEKNAGLVVSDPTYFALDSIPSNAIIFNSLDDNAANFKDFVFYFVDSVQSENAGPVLAQKITLEIALFIYDRADLFIQQRTLRALRALFETASDLWSVVGRGVDRPEVIALTPIDLQLNNSSYYHKIVAVRLEFSIAN